MDRKTKKVVKLIQAMDTKGQVKAIQAMNIEGVNFDVAMSSLLDGSPITSVEGTETTYRTYSSQVMETYRKYRGEAEVGNVPVKTLIDGRTAFIAGEAMSLAMGEKGTDNHTKLFNKFIEANNLKSNKLFDITKQTEMQGYSIVVLSKTNEKAFYIPMLGIIPTYDGKAMYYPILGNTYNINDVQGFNKKQGGETTVAKIKDFVFFRTGGDGISCDKFNTKVGSVLNECDNLDRSLKDMRRINNVGARITPDFETKTKSETDALTSWLKANKWKHGQARIGTAKFSYKAPGTGPIDNLSKEAVTNVKSMSGITGMPPHWLGWVDQMSNRATAEELFASVNNATIMERNIIVAALKVMFIKMQQLYIDSGGDLISEVTDDFEIKLPLIDFGRFKAMIESYSLLYADDVISLETYRNKVPDIDNSFEKEQIEAEKKANPEVTKTDIDASNDDDEEDDKNKKDGEN